MRGMSSRTRHRSGAGVVLAILLAACGGGSPTPVRGGGESAPPPAAIAATLAIRGATVFDGERSLGVADVLIDGDRIVAVGPDLAVPAGATIVEGAGKTLVPGLIDAHVHVWVEAALEMELAFGVTTVLDMMGLPQAAAKLRAAAAARPEYADFRGAGNPVIVPGGVGTQYGVPYALLDDPANVDAFVDEIAEGADFIKLVADDASGLGMPRPLPTLDAATLAKAVARAHHHDKRAVVHVTRAADATIAIEAGADGLAHLFADAPASDAFVALARDRGAFVIATLTAMHALVGSDAGAQLALDPAIAPYLDSSDVDNLGKRLPPPMVAASQMRLAHAEASVRALHAAGVPILAGTDAPNPGMAYGASLHHELALLVAAGLTPAEALHAATAATAHAFGLADRGRVAVGLRADLVLLDGDPLTDITATRAIAAIWRGGVAYDRAIWEQKAAAYSAGLADD
jgi:imidazolonepropionase-like amidohydrolase